MTFRFLRALFVALLLTLSFSARAETITLVVAPAAEEAKKPPEPVRIDITGPIDGDTFDVIKTKVEGAKDNKAPRLDIHLNSPGGSLGAGLLIIQAIVDSGIPTVCTVDTMAMSMAAIILESPACGERVVSSTALVMFHAGKLEASGDERDLQNANLRSAAMNRVVALIVTARTGWTVEQYTQAVVNEGRELWFVGAEAVQVGAADRVLLPLQPVREKS